LQYVKRVNVAKYYYYNTVTLFVQLANETKQVC